MEQNYDKEYWKQPCPNVQCKKKKTCKDECGLKFVSIPAVLGDDSEGSVSFPKNGLYCNAIVRYEANGAIYIFSNEGVPVKIKEGQ